MTWFYSTDKDIFGLILGICKVTMKVVWSPGSPYWANGRPVDILGHFSTVPAHAKPIQPIQDEKESWIEFLGKGTTKNELKYL